MTQSERRVALVTGAAGALGHALVARLMQAGPDCIALDRNRRGLEKMHDEFVASVAMDGAPLIVPLDLAGAGPEQFAELAETLDAQFGRLDLLIHAAAEFRALAPLEHQPADEWMQVLQTGLTGPFLLSQALLPLMRRTPGSRMVWVADDPEGKCKAYWGAYGVAQAGRDALAAILAAECRRDGPEVTLVDPGPFHSPLRSRAWPAENPAGLATADEAAATVLEVLETGD
ncbi:MAG: SDR family NAD(P)-dependent oxidoreductase [Wenzhouxiangellaceae bacterium]|nr:SDR family NAD(P)-dependent oxidoreductase [Wenzhouxiangellaceae bacterium]